MFLLLPFWIPACCRNLLMLAVELDGWPVHSIHPRRNCKTLNQVQSISCYRLSPSNAKTLLCNRFVQRSCTFTKLQPWNATKSIFCWLRIKILMDTFGFLTKSSLIKTWAPTFSFVPLDRATKSQSGYSKSEKHSRINCTSSYCSRCSNSKTNKNHSSPRVCFYATKRPIDRFIIPR